METVQYIGETLWPGQLGHILIILSFVASLFAVYSFYHASNPDKPQSWKTMGRLAYLTHGISVFGIIGILFYVMSQLMYEYSYVFDHCSDDLPMRYIFSAFWEGQEGSFLLWMFWHSVLGFFLMRKAGEWEAPVMMFLALIEVVLASMLLGIHIEIGDWTYKLGSNPTLLLRDVFDAPIFSNADYLQSIKGDGLNPLLQNYWMTIHPPTLFLGFASCSIPFAYAAAGLFTKKYTEWLKPVLPWALWAAGILGIGILMGAAWAYEALTFGGYWAWDPVENMSLVPWIIFVAGIHTNLIARSTGRAIKSTYIYYCLGFVLVLYSTYLTRSGILGDTSAHSFTEMGLEPQLIFLVSFFALLSLVLYSLRSKFVPVKEKEESIYSREFWMFVGALVLLFSGMIISASTSLPVFNAIINIFDEEFKGTVINDAIPHYNKFQIWTSILISVLSAKTIFLRYKAEKLSPSQFKKLAITNFSHFGIAVLLTGLLSITIDYYHWKYILLTVCCIFTMVANFSYLITHLKNNFKLAGAVISHFGFGLMVVGTIASGLNEFKISSNPFAMKGIVDEEDLGKVVKLIKNQRLFSKGYWLTYQEDTIINNQRTFKIKFEETDQEGESIDSFHVYPNVLFSNDLTKVAATNPDAHHYIEKDIFVAVQSLPPSQVDIELAKEAEDSLKYKTYTLGIGDTLFTKDKFGVLEYVTFDPKNPELIEQNNDVNLGLGIRFYNFDKTFDTILEPAIALKENLLYQYPDHMNDLGLKVKLNDTSFDSFFTTEDQLEYQVIEVKQGEKFTFDDTSFQLLGFNQNINNPNYKVQDNDVAVQAMVNFETAGSKKILNPIYVIRNGKPFSIKDYDPFNGYHLRLSHIDPQEEKFIIQIAKDVRDTEEMVVEIAENVPRTDYIAIEATVFPGINLFWSGASFMMLGLLLAMYHRLSSKYEGRP